MKRLRLVLFSALALALAGGLIVGLVSEPEVQYEGVPLSRWLADLQSESAETRVAAAYALARIEVPSEKVVPYLGRSLNDAHDDVRLEAVRSLRELGGPANLAALPALTEALQDSTVNVRFQTLWLLSELGLEARSSAPGLIDMLSNDRDPRIRAFAVYVAGAAAPGDAAVISALAAALENDLDKDVRLAVLDAFADMGLKGAATTDALRAALANDERLTLQVRAGEVLVALEGEGARDEVDSALEQARDRRFRFQFQGDIALALSMLREVQPPGCDLRGDSDLRTLARFSTERVAWSGALSAVRDGAPNLVWEESTQGRIRVGGDGDLSNDAVLHGVALTRLVNEGKTRLRNCVAVELPSGEHAVVYPPDRPRSRQEEIARVLDAVNAGDTVVFVRGPDEDGRWVAESVLTRASWE